jgi:hypothetical protein
MAEYGTSTMLARRVEEPIAASDIPDVRLLPAYDNRAHLRGQPLPLRFSSSATVAGRNPSASRICLQRPARQQLLRRPLLPHTRPLAVDASGGHPPSSTTLPDAGKRQMRPPAEPTERLLVPWCPS